MRHREIVDNLSADCSVKRTSPNAAPVSEVLQPFLLTARTDGRRFSQSERMREDPTSPEWFEREAVVGNDPVRRFLQPVDPVPGAQRIARHAEPIWGALPETIVPDGDSTVQPADGQQEGAEVGHNPGKPGRRSYHPRLAVVSRTPLCPVCRFRSSKTVSASQEEEARPGRARAGAVSNGDTNVPKAADAHLGGREHPGYAEAVVPKSTALYRPVPGPSPSAKPGRSRATADRRGHPPPARSGGGSEGNLLFAAGLANLDAVGPPGAPPPAPQPRVRRDFLARRARRLQRWCSPATPPAALRGGGSGEFRPPGPRGAQKCELDGPAFRLAECR